MTEARRADLASSTSPAAVSFNPYVLWRRGTLPYSALVPLVPKRTWALLDEMEAGRVTRQEIARRLGDRLYVLIPTLPAGERAEILRLRRDVHNDRLPPAEIIRAVDPLLDANDSAALSEWRQLREAAERLRVTASDLFVRELEGARRQLGRVASETLFLEGIQLSGPHVYRSVRDYIAETARERPARLTKRLRQTEATIVRYAYRMALRTSPFGAFTEVGATPWHPSSRGADPNERRHLVRLNRGTLVWMVGELRRIEGIDRVLQLRLNNTARRVNGSVEVFARGVKGSSDSYLGERVVQIRAVKPVQMVIDALASGPRSKADVLQRLADHGATADQASALVERLIEAGLCHQDFALPDQTTGLAGAVAERIRTVSTGPAAACAELFEQLQQIEDEFGAATVDERDALLASLDHGIQRFAEVCGTQPPAMARTLLFEDVAAHRPARTWCPEIVERNRDHFLRLQRLLPVFDDATFARLGMYRWFVSRYGEGGRGDDLLTAYRAFAEQSPADITAVMQGTNEPAADAIRSQQRVILQRLADRVAAAGNAPTLRLDDELVDELVAGLPSTLTPWTEASYRLQLVAAGVDGPSLLVVNNVTAGHGVFFSRFCDLVEPADPQAWSLRRSMRDTIARNSPRQADLTAVLGVNVNLHPSLAPLEVVYPGSMATNGDALTLRDLALEADPHARTLRLVSRRDGQPVDLTPMNFLLPVAAPMLYRFLCVLTPLQDYGMGLWDRLRHWSQREHDYLPRLTLGDLVLERRRWSVPLTELRALISRANPEHLDSLLEMRRWHGQRGIPRECFFRTQRWVNRGVSGDWTEQTQRALNVRGARRKSHYLDFRNPFLVRLLVDRVQSADEGVVAFHECLPPTDTYRAQEHESAEELLVEIRYSVRNASAALLPVARHDAIRQAPTAHAPSTDTAIA